MAALALLAEVTSRKLALPQSAGKYRIPKCLDASNLVAGLLIHTQPAYLVALHSASTLSAVAAGNAGRRHLEDSLETDKNDVSVAVDLNLRWFAKDFCEFPSLFGSLLLTVSRWV